MKKLFLSVFGGFLVLLGLIFIIIPGPSLLFIIPGLFLLSFEYPLAKKWLRKSMKVMGHTARWVDKKMWQRKYSN